MPASRAFRCPLRALPEVRLAGRFLLDDRAHDTAYLSSTHALHLHDYSGTIRLLGQEHPLEPGTVTLSPGGHKSTYDLPEPGYHHCIHFRYAVKDRGPSVRLPLVRTLGPKRTFVADRMMHI